MRQWAVLCIVTLCVIIAAAAAAKPFKNPVKAPGIDVKTIETLLDFGQVLIVQTDENGRSKLTTGGILINAPSEKVWSVLMDYEKYPEFMPSTENVTVLRKEGNIVDTKFRVVFQFSVLKYEVEYSTRNVNNPPYSSTWELIDGDIDATYGGWELIPVSGGRTAAFYSAYSDIRSVGYVVRKVLDAEPSFEVAVNSSTVILVLQAIKDRVEHPEKTAGGRK